MSFNVGGSAQRNDNQQTTQNDVPDWLKTAYLENLGKATAIRDSGFTAYDPAKMVAQDNPFEDLAQYRTLQAADMGQGAIGQAQNVFAGVANDSPTWFDPALVAQSAYGQAGQIGDVLDVMPERATTWDAQAGTVAGSDLSAYLNPYQASVIDQSNAELGRQRQMAQSQNAYAASQAGAFGGSRHGIVDAENNRNFAKLQQDSTNSLLQAGYGQAQGLLQSDLERLAGASQFNAAARNTASLSNAAAMNAAMTGNADRDLAARTADAAARQAASFANAAADNQRNQFNAQQITDANNGYRQADLAQSGLNLQGAQGLLSAAQQQQGQYLAGANALASSGASQRGIDQARLDAAYNEFLRGQQDPFVKQQLANASIFGVPASAIGSSSTQGKATQIGANASAAGRVPGK